MIQHVRGNRSWDHRPRGFTLRELMVVTGVIFALALLVPTVNVERGPRQGACMSNLKAMIQGLKMYRDDHGEVPDALYGISYDGRTVETRLYPMYVKDWLSFTCSHSPVKFRSHDELAPAVNRFTGTVAMIPAFSSYDVQVRNPGSSTPLCERHYCPDWTGNAEWTPGDRRLLAAPEPADNAVVTWCLYHAEMDRRTGAVKPGKRALVAFWDGRVQKLPAEKLSEWPDAEGRYPWEVPPKP